MNFQDYESTLAELKALWPTLRQESNTMNAELAAALAADYKTVYPRRKYNQAKFAQCPNGEAIHANFKARAEKWLEEEYRPTEKALETKLNTIALECLPNHTAELNHVCTVYSGSYASQGFGCEKYTRESAERFADMARFHGFTAELRKVGTPFRDKWGIVYQDWGIFVDCSAAGWDLLKRRPGQSLREWLKSCWGKGVNPRVYNPFLPYGIEEKLGLDYFGNDTPGWQPTA